MFDAPCKFTYVTHSPPPSGEEYIRLHTYKFFLENELYLVRAEEYQYQVFAIKFYPKRYQESPNRYRMLTGEKKASRVIATCVHIMLDLIAKFPSASLGFIGSELEGENKANTKRFRVYRSVMENLFSPLVFSHNYYEASSVYLLLNRKQEDPDILKKIEALFVETFAFDPKPPFNPE